MVMQLATKLLLKLRTKLKQIYPLPQVVFPSHPLSLMLACYWSVDVLAPTVTGHHSKLCLLCISLQ